MSYHYEKWVNFLADFRFRNWNSNAFWQGIILQVTSKNGYSENPSLARHGSDSAGIEINNVSTLTRIDFYLEPPPPPLLTSRLPIPRCRTSKKVSKCDINAFSTFLTCFFSNISDFFANLREPCRISGPSPHRGMWATFWRSGADVGGNENSRGDPWWERPVRCVGEGVETTIPSAISNSQHPNSSIYEHRRFQKPAKDVMSPPTTHFPHDNHPSRRKVSFRCPPPPSLTTAAPTCAVPPKLRRCDWSNTPPATPLIGSPHNEDLPPCWMATWCATTTRP